MTKYQRGELMEGWNDCPIPVPTPSSGAPSASSTLKARKRMYRLSTAGGLQNSSESSLASSARSLMMPPPPSNLPPPPSRVASGPPNAPVKDVEDVSSKEEVDFSESERKLRELVASDRITDKDKEFFTKRLVEAFPGLAISHKHFIAQVVDGMAAGELSGALKTRVLNYMMANNGVSVWAVPLKKLVETPK